MSSAPISVPIVGGKPAFVRVVSVADGGLEWVGPVLRGRMLWRLSE
jgi:hypothetical protein